MFWHFGHFMTYFLQGIKIFMQRLTDSGDSFLLKNLAGCD
jgi:hypothetical protein